MPQAEPQTRAVRVVQGEGLLDIEDGDFEYWPGFLDAKETASCFAALQEQDRLAHPESVRVWPLD